MSEKEKIQLRKRQEYCGSSRHPSTISFCCVRWQPELVTLQREHIIIPIHPSMTAVRTALLIRYYQKQASALRASRIQYDTTAGVRPISRSRTKSERRAADTQTMETNSLLVFVSASHHCHRRVPAQRVGGER